MHASVHFYESLNDFLSRDRRDADIDYTFGLSGSVKDVIESLGVPHPEIGSIEANGIPVDFSYLVQNHDQIQVFPQNKSSILWSGSEPKFVLDTHLGTLSSNLRLLGFDTLYRNDYSDEELARISATEDRILLTRDVGLLKRSSVIYGYFVRATHSQKQIEEIVRKFQLSTRAKPFSRCLRCNGCLHAVAKSVVADQLPERVAEHFHDFTQCDRCHRVYWEGSHVIRMRRVLEQLLTSDISKH